MAKVKQDRLTAVEKALLDEILTLVLRSGSPIDGANFRIAHPQDRDTLRDLVTRNLLARERNADKYYVPLLGLDALGSDESRRILALGDKLVDALKARFSDERQRHKEFHVTEIAYCLGTSIDECLLILLHLKDAVENWWGGSSANWPAKDAWILPSERACEWPSTGDFIRQRKDWLGNHDVSRKSAARTTLAGGHQNPVLVRAPSWHRDLRQGPLRTLFGEIHRARQVDCPALAVLGLRTALDTMCNEMWGDLGSFKAKLQKLSDEGLIARKQHDQLAAAIEVGNATTHRGHIPTRRDADTVHDIVEALIKQHYSLDARASNAAKRVPGRVKGKNRT